MLTQSVHNAYANKPQYNLYTSLIQTYEQEWGNLRYKQIEDMVLYDVWGLSFIKLLDLDADGVLELILVRMNEKMAKDGTSTQSENQVMQIFTLENGQNLKQIGAFSLLLSGLSPSVEWVNFNGKNYIVTGDASDAMDWHKVFWGFGKQELVKVKEFKSAYTGNGASGMEFFVGNSAFDEKGFKSLYGKWTENLHNFPVSNCTLQMVETLQAHNAKEKQQLVSYAPASLGDSIKQNIEAKIFGVKFLGYTSSWGGMPDLEPYFSMEELHMLNHQDFGGEEMYIVKNNLGSETKVYEALIDDMGAVKSGRLLHTFKAKEPMFFSCNISETRPNIILRYTTPQGEIFDYIPSINLMDGSPNYATHGEALKTK